MAVNWPTITILCLVLMAGCDRTDSKPDDTGDAADMVLTDHIVHSDTSIETLELPDLTGRTYRVYEMFAIEPTDKINETWQVTIEDYSLILLFRVVSHDPAAGTMIMDAGAGWADREEQADGTFTISSFQFGLVPGQIHFQFTGNTFVVTQPFELDLFPLTVNKPFHIHKVVGHGHFSEDGSRLEEIFMDGFLAEAQVIDFCLILPGFGSVNFHWFMNLAGICALTDSDGDDLPDSYNFKGILRAQDESHLFVEGIHPIEPQVAECNVHADPCIPAEQ